MQDFHKLEVWQRNRAFTVEIYRLTATFPPDERFGLISQMRRAVIGVGSCIAEGCGRGTIKDTLHFSQMSFSSSTELLHHVMTSSDLGYVSEEQFGELSEKPETIRKMLGALMRKLRRGK